MDSLLETMKAQDRRMKLAFEAHELMWARKEREWLRKEKEYLQREVEWRAKEQAWLKREQELLQKRRDSHETVIQRCANMESREVTTTADVHDTKPSPIVEGDKMDTNPSINVVAAVITEATANVVADKGDSESSTAQEASQIEQACGDTEAVCEPFAQSESDGSTNNIKVVEVASETPALSDLEINLRPQWLISRSFSQIYTTPAIQEVSIEMPENIQGVVEEASSEPTVSQVDSKTLTPDDGEPLKPPTAPLVVETEQDVQNYYKNKKKKKRGKKIQGADEIPPETPVLAIQDVSTEISEPTVCQLEPQTLGFEEQVVSADTSESEPEINLRPHWLIQRSFSQIYPMLATQEVSIETPENIEEVVEGTSSETITAVDSEVLKPPTGSFENQSDLQEPAKPEETEEDISVYLGVNWNQKKKKKNGKKKLVFDSLEDPEVPPETPAQSDPEINLRPQWMRWRSFSHIYPTPAIPDVSIQTPKNIQEVVEGTSSETVTAVDGEILKPPTGLVENPSELKEPAKPEETEEDISVYLGVNWNQKKKKHKGKKKLVLDSLEDPEVPPETPAQSGLELNLRPQWLIRRSFSQIYTTPATQEVIETENIQEVVEEALSEPIASPASPASQVDPQTLGIEDAVVPPETPAQTDPEINLRPQWLIWRLFSQIYPTPANQDISETPENIQEVVEEASFEIMTPVNGEALEATDIQTPAKPEPRVCEVDSKTFTPDNGEPLESPTENNKPVVSGTAPLVVETEQHVQNYYKNKKKKKRGTRQRASEIQTETPA